MLDDVVGAEDYRKGLIQNPNKVGVRALDDLTLEVQLRSPANYFLYIVALPVAFPLPSWIIHEHVDEWWKPEYIVSNGPFYLKFFSDECIRFVRNTSYFKSSEGNLDEWVFIMFEWENLVHRDQLMNEAFREGEIDEARVSLADIHSDFPQELIRREPHTHTIFVFLNPTIPPMNNKGFREAIAQAVNIRTIDPNLIPALTPADGGLIHPRTPGHSPMIGFRHDIKSARMSLDNSRARELSEFTQLNFAMASDDLMELVNTIAAQINEALGVPVVVDEEPTLHQELDSHIWISGWEPDYPDPDGTLRGSSYRMLVERSGYKQQEFNTLLNRAADELDRKLRLSLFREIDHWLVSQEVLFVPLFYGSENLYLERPSTTDMPLTHFNLENVVIKNE
jgi:oligopeptide transport system substrate-binding protein